MCALKVSFGVFVVLSNKFFHLNILRMSQNIFHGERGGLVVESICPGSIPKWGTALCP